MPVVDIKLNVCLDSSTLEGVVADLTEALASLLDPSCRQVMISHAQGALCINGSPAPAALVELRTVAPLSPEAKRQTCRRVAQILSERADIEPSRMFLQFSCVPPGDAWNIVGGAPSCVLDRVPDRLRAADAGSSS